MFSSKHMDKHDRPYRCEHQSCAKLLGFTYSGGLLRHEREVHGKHGGPKAQLMCPHEDCKRHAGKGFTRKENLNEHIRRVHDSKPQSAQPVAQISQNLPYQPENLRDAIAGADEFHDTPVAQAVMVDNIEPSFAAKRKHSVSDSEDMESIKQELKRLRTENEHLRETVMRQTHNHEQEGNPNHQGED